jgi:phosphoribosylglycinamide formyltransferase-1
MAEPLRILAMASGGGRTVLNLHARITSGALPGVTMHDVFVSREDCAAADRCRDAGLDVHLPGERIDAAVQRCFDTVKPDIVLLCGYLRHLHIPDQLQHRVMNIHPALLPDFGGKGMYGDRVHAAVLASGARTSGCTVHLVDDQFDHGPIVLQQSCPVEPGDDATSLAARVFALECETMPEAVSLAAQGRLRLSSGAIDVAPSGEGWPDALFARC